MAARQFLECLKAQGYSSKSTPLKDVLKQSKRQEAMLIGYNEVASIPKLVEVQLPRRPVQLDLLLVEANVQENSCSRNPPSIPVSSASDADPHTACATSTVNARSHLNNICTAKHWRPPVFDCLGETGPDHLKQFVYKVLVQIAGKQNEEFVFIGEPRLKKKDAAERAAEGALWHLQNEGYIT